MEVFNNIDDSAHQEYIFKEGNITFKINYRDNFDLYWSIFKLGEKTPLTYQEFIITKENPLYIVYLKSYTILSQILMKVILNMELIFLELVNM